MKVLAMMAPTMNATGGNVDWHGLAVCESYPGRAGCRQGRLKSAYQRVRRF